MTRHDDDLPAVPRRRHRRPTDTEIERACHPGVGDRALTALGYYTPELTTAAVAAGAAATVWAPLALVSAAALGKVAGERVLTAWRNRARTNRPTDTGKPVVPAEPTNDDTTDDATAAAPPGTSTAGADAPGRDEWEVAG